MCPMKIQVIYTCTHMGAYALAHMRKTVATWRDHRTPIKENIKSLMFKRNSVSKKNSFT
jgi:hypothetical protein